MNSIALVGRLGADPEIKYFQNGRHVLNFSLAVDRGRKKPNSDEWETDWFKVALWANKSENGDDSKAERLLEKLKKGAVVSVKGAMLMESYTDKEGVNRVQPKVDAADVKFVAPARGHDQGSEAPAPRQQQATQRRAPAQQTADTEEIPF